MFGRFKNIFYLYINQNTEIMYIPKEDRDSFIGKRIILILMGDDPDPIPSGTKGTIEYIDDAGIVHPKWDNGRTLGLVPKVDMFEIIEPICTDGLFRDCHLFYNNHCKGCPVFK